METTSENNRNVFYFPDTLFYFTRNAHAYLGLPSLNVVIGVGMAGVGMNVMHDGNHGAYSSKSWVNKFMGGTIYILAGNVYNWQVQHNVLHHTYTNILGHDEDLEAGRIMRFTKEAKWYRFHKFQHYYSVFLYGLLTFNWAITTDFLQMKRYLKRNLSYGEFKNPPFAGQP